MSVKAWREAVVIPTYEIGEPEKNPIFLEKRVYQGSSGVVYPYPVVESIANEKVDKEWNAVWLENEYIKVMILPELGGRVQMAYDKIKQRHFVYYNHVIKPALVGLTGPWISGGIEFNWPQHHRPSTYLPVDSIIVENEDGSVTVWVNEQERMFHQKGMAGFTLRPGCAYLEIKGTVYNPTDMPQTFLWWANPAVAVNDEYQSVFPPDINAVFDHGKRAVSSFPIATGTYYKMDYSAGVDISNYKNIKVPTSYMAVNSQYDFEGGYENDTKGGMLHVADHHFSPGKKQWTWGNGDFGRAWDRALTDEDGPYIELMAGVYTENQPDFTWLMPYEEKRFTQYFMPYRELGIVKNASKDVIFNVEETADGNAMLRVLVTNRRKVEIHAINNLTHEDVYVETEVELSPEMVCERVIDLKGMPFGEVLFSVDDLMWVADDDEIRPIPDAAEAALLPQDIKTNDQLYLTGLHLEQYRHATYSPVDYYEEALRRDPLDYRCNNALGLWYIRKGRFDIAEKYLRTAVKVLMKRNPNPYDGEPIYNLGLALKYQNKLGAAYDMFWKATWNKAWADAGYFEAAKISMWNMDYASALDEINRCIDNNWHNHKARALKTTLLRILDRIDEAQAFAEESLQFDKFNYGCIYELYLLTEDEAVLQQMKDMMHGMANNYDELGLDYLHIGCTDEAYDVWALAIEEGAVTPMTYYYQNHFTLMFSDKAANAKPDCCFPNRLDDISVLDMAMKMNPDDAMAPYYLGCLYYDKRQYDLAQNLWETSVERKADFPTAHRNLALVYYNKCNDAERALKEMEQAYSLDETDSRVLMELDQLYKRMQKPHQWRLDFLQKHPAEIQKRDDLVLEEITLLNQLGRYEEAMERLAGRQFHVWEGGEGKVSGQYQICRIEHAKLLIAEVSAGSAVAAENRAAAIDRAITLLEECLVFPHNIGEGKLQGAQDNDYYYFLGRAYELKGDEATAKRMFVKGTEGPTEPAAAMYYNDAKPDKIFYAALCFRALGEEDKARGLFYKLVNYGQQHIFDNVVMDYFAVSLPDLLVWDGDLNTANVLHCNYLLALGHYGLGNETKARKFLAKVQDDDINHLGAQALQRFMELGI